MRKIWILLFCVALGINIVKAQDTITKTDIRIASKLLHVELKDAEIDSLYPGLIRNINTIKRMHEVALPNAVPLSLWQLPVSPAQLQGTSDKNQLQIRQPYGVKMPAEMKDLAFFSIPQLAELIRSKQISSLALTRFFLERLKKYDDTLHCVISLTEDLAIEQAKRADSLLEKGKYLGLLHGIPYGLKDLFAVKGTKTTWGAAPYKNQVIDEDAYVYQQLRDAGAVLLVKLSLGALAQGDWWFGGRTRSPWNPERGSSGSSAGSASATVAGLVPFAIGTETWGSIVSPSTACGATGLRPTFGSISRTGAMTLSWSLDKIGPLCRSAEDAAIVFSFIRGVDANDGVPAQKPFAFNANADFKKLRVGYAKNYFDRLDSTTNDWKVLETIRELGVTLQPMVFPNDSMVWPFDIMGLVIGAECAAAFDAFTRSDLDDQMTRQNRGDWPNSFRTWRFIPAVEYINANRHRTILTQAIIKAMSDFDVVITPSFAGNQLAITNLTGHPAVCLPNGFDNRTGLPTSITFLGNLWEEGKILLLANAFQEATDWSKRRPPLFK